MGTLCKTRLFKKARPIKTNMQISIFKIKWFQCFKWNFTFCKCNNYVKLLLNWINPIQVSCFYFSRLTWKPDVLLEWKTLCLRDWSLVWRFYGLEAMLFTIKWEWIETNASNQMIFPPILKIHGTFIKGFEDIHREQKWKKEVCKYNLFDFTYFFYS